MKAFLPLTYVPNAAKDEFGRWNMGEPDSMVRHFNSAAAKLQYNKKLAELAEDDEEGREAAYMAATHAVPVYRGYCNKTAKYFIRQGKRAQRLLQAQQENGIFVDDDELIF